MCIIGYFSLFLEYACQCVDSHECTRENICILTRIQDALLSFSLHDQCSVASNKKFRRQSTFHPRERRFSFPILRLERQRKSSSFFYLMNNFPEQTFLASVFSREVHFTDYWEFGLSPCFKSGCTVRPDIIPCNGIG